MGNEKVGFKAVAVTALLTFCTLAIPAKGIEQITDDTGTASFSDMTEGEYKITVAKPGYIESSVSENVEFAKDEYIVEINISPPPKVVNRPSTPYANIIIGSLDVEADTPFSHQDYIAKFEAHLGLTSDDIESPATRAEVANLFEEMFEAEHRNDGMDFHDITTDDWHHDYIHSVSRKEIMIGYGDGSFRPLDNITRAEIAAVIVRIMGYSDTSAIEFTDINEGHWAADYISKISASGIMIGGTDSVFRPDDTVTRAEMVIIINRLMGIENFEIAGSLP